MSATTINFDKLETLMTTLKQDEALPFVKYEELYERLARGKTSDTDEILTILKRTGKTRQDLEADVRWRICRTGIIREYQLIPQLETEYDKASAEVRKLNTEQEKMEEEYERKNNRTARREISWSIKFVNIESIGKR